MLYKRDDRKPFYNEIQFEIRGLFAAGSASDYFPLRPTGFASIASISGVSVFILQCQSHLRFSRLQGKTKCVICHAEGNMSCVSDKRVIQGERHHQYTLCCRASKLTLLLEIKRVKHRKSPKFPDTGEPAKSWILAHILLRSMSKQTFFWSVSSRARQSFV